MNPALATSDPNICARISVPDTMSLGFPGLRRYGDGLFSESFAGIDLSVDPTSSFEDSGPMWATSAAAPSSVSSIRNTVFNNDGHGAGYLSIS